MKNAVSDPHGFNIPTMSGRHTNIEGTEGFYIYILGNEANGKLAVSMTQDIQTRVRSKATTALAGFAAVDSHQNTRHKPGSRAAGFLRGSGFI